MKYAQLAAAAAAISVIHGPEDLAKLEDVAKDGPPSPVTQTSQRAGVRLNRSRKWDRDRSQTYGQARAISPSKNPVR